MANAINQKKFQWAIKELLAYVENGFTGSVEIHMFKGGVGSIKEVVVKKPPEEKE